MRHVLPNRQPTFWLTVVMLAASWVMCDCQRGASAPPPDPVEELRNALALSAGDISDPTPVALEFRKKLLKQKVDALKTASELRRALTLEEWNKGTTNETTREQDATLRKEIGDRLTDKVKTLVKGGDATSRLAAATFIAEMGPFVRALKPNDRSGFARSLTLEVSQLAENDLDPGVRMQALRALGSINAEPKNAAPVFGRVLAKFDVRDTRMAADGLGQMVRIAIFLRNKQKGSGVEVTPAELSETAVEAVKAIKPGLKNPDPLVRAACFQVLQAAGRALSDLTPQIFPARDFPPPERKLSKEEQEMLKLREAAVLKAIEEIRPLNEEIRRQEALLAEGLADADSRVRRGAIEALQSLASARLRWRRYVLSVPVTQKENKAWEMLNSTDPLPLFTTKYLPNISGLLADSDVRIRRTAVEFLENLEEFAAPALPAVTHALTDSDRFVRWAAARTIAAIGTDKAAMAVPNLTKLLGDDDLTVRIESAKTLTLLEDKAKAAIPALARAVVEGDVESRQAALLALQSMSPEYVKSTVPQILQALRHADVRMRRLAAETLGKIGPAANQTGVIPALREALGDEDQEVRVNASDALLSIILPPPRKL